MNVQVTDFFNRERHSNWRPLLRPCWEQIPDITGDKIFIAGQTLSPGRKEELQQAVNNLKLGPPLDFLNPQVVILDQMAEGLPLASFTISTKDSREPHTETRISVIVPVELHGSGQDAVDDWFFHSILTVLKHELGESIYSGNQQPFYPHRVRL